MKLHFCPSRGRRWLLLAGLAATVASHASSPAENWTIESVAGTGVPGFAGDGGPARDAQVNDPYGVVRGPDGALWFCEVGGQRIRRIAPDGTLTTIAGTGATGHSGDGGPAREATFDRPHEIRFDRDGHLYIADMANQVIRRIDARTGVITTVAGTPRRKGYTGDGGPATEATLNSPHSIQFGPNGDLFICDVSNHVIRRVDRETGLISTFAGTGRPGPTPDGAPINGTPLNNPRSIDFDRTGDLWLVTREGNQVFRFDLHAGRIHHVAGTGETGFTGNGGPARLATLSGPKGITIDGAGDVWLADTESHTVRRINARTGNLEWIAGSGERGDGGDGPARACALNRLHGIFADSDAAIYIGDSEAHRLRVLRPAPEGASTRE